ncbi:acyl-CoA synthetase [Sphingomonas bacterium]|uniref:acyl-CoA synthetase n=1 Tax=Sphingomonas bacterium TaxID=1895847 RepID=UPI00266F42B4|nr:acyl-CoA synthetase [Sphingomonas bacterium]
MTATPSFADWGGKPAIVMGTGGVTTFAELETESNRFARLFRRLGLNAGDVLAVCVENRPEFLQAACAAMRSGLTFVPISAKLTAAEIAFIVVDSGAKALLTSPGIGDTFPTLPSLLTKITLVSIGPARPGFTSWPDERTDLPAAPIADEAVGSEMLYSSGTTGRPKGIRYRTRPGEAAGVTESVLSAFRMLDVDGGVIYLCPAPLYHSAPYGWSMATLLLGGTVVVMERFDPEEALALIERHRVTISQWVPTHFVRLLKLPDSTRAHYDLSSLRLAVHAAAPCPVPVKRAMIDWFGPILLEYFGSSEQTALTFIGSAEWLEHPGSVGRCVFGTLHICDDAGEPVAPGTIGQIHSDGAADFFYHNDPVKTARARNGRGWSTVGDLGYLDEDGYLFLTDRKGFMIITGGVNVYPQEIENLLVTHPRVADAGVIGLPDADLGERVTAVIQPLDMADATPGFARELDAWLRRQLSSVKAPKRIIFRAELPRLPTGKMVKHVLREQVMASE